MNILQNPRILATSLKKHKLTVAVYGLGHVGSALSAVWLRAGARSIGVDISEDVIKMVSKGISSVNEPGVSQAFGAGIRKGRFIATMDGIHASRMSDFKIIAVPVGLHNGLADISRIYDAAMHIAKGLKKGDVVSVNPTVPPGTTKDCVLPILEKESGLMVEKQFGLVYSPERISEGQAIQDIEQNYAAIVAGMGSKSLAAGSALYSLISKKSVIKLSSIRAAETEKLFEGIYRDVNIALANEFAKVCEKLGVDYWEIRKAANSQPYSHLHKPGIGVGGACIPVYPYFVMEVAAKLKAGTDITGLARQVNSIMPKYCVQEALSLLRKCGKSTTDSRVLVLGLAFRGGVSDTRLSPSYEVVQELLNTGCKVTVHDPYAEDDQSLPESVVFTNKLEVALSDADLIILATDHPQYAKINPKKLGDVIAIYDGRGILDPYKYNNIMFSGIGRVVGC